MDFWETLIRVVTVTSIVMFIAIIVIGVLAYYAVKSAIQRLDVVVTTVKTATHQAVAAVEKILQTTGGIFQDVKHEIGDLIAFVKEQVENGIYRIDEDNKLIKQQLNQVSYYVLDGHFKDTTMFADIKQLMHKVVDGLVAMPRTLTVTDGTRNYQLDFQLNSFSDAYLKAAELIPEIVTLPINIPWGNVNVTFNEKTLDFSATLVQRVTFDDLLDL
jgi:hypothetical protein